MSEELSTDRESLRRQLTRLLGWEKRKRLEAVLAMALFYALLGALCVQPFIIVAWRDWAWAAPMVFLAVLAPYFYFTRRWGGRDSQRALAAVDRALRLDERATTAWELLQRNETRAVAILVLRQAGDKLRGFDPRARFPRIWSWQGYLIAPLLALWLAMLWFDVGFQPRSVQTASSSSLSQSLREFARKLQEKARSESLPKTLKAGQEMEKLAQRGIADKADDDRLKRELAGMAKKMAAERSTSGPTPFGTPDSRQQLQDLRAELEAARDLLNLDGAQGPGQGWQDRLTGLTQLKKQLDQQNRGTQGMSSGEMRSFLDQLDKQVSGELDRRALLEAEEYLQRLAQRGQGSPGEAQARASGDEEDAAPQDGQRDRNTGVAPGEQPGKNLDKPPSLPEFRGGARAQVKGKIGEGERSGIVFKARPAPGKSKLSQEEVIASYRRQAEAELSTERIPAELKDTIKNYFLSLEKTN